MYSPKLMFAFAIIALFCLTGARCVASGSSGGSSSDKRDPDKDPHGDGVVVVITSDSGQLNASTTEGVMFKSGAGPGYTTAKGEFEYDTNEPQLRFFIGDIPLGRTVEAKKRVTTLDLVAEGNINNRAVINIARFMQSLDAVPGDDRITIPRTVHDKAVKTNAMVAADIESLNFADEVAFINAASNLIAVLTADYPFTASLVDAVTAQARLRADLAALDV